MINWPTYTVYNNQFYIQVGKHKRATLFHGVGGKKHTIGYPDENGFVYVPHAKLVQLPGIEIEGVEFFIRRTFDAWIISECLTGLAIGHTIQNGTTQKECISATVERWNQGVDAGFFTLERIENIIKKHGVSPRYQPGHGKGFFGSNFVVKKN